jgi:hypothetical protein
MSRDENTKSPRQTNPCCGIKLKVAVLVIAAVDIAYGVIFLAFGLVVKLSKETPTIFTSGLELINLIGRPGAKIVFGIVLLASAKMHLKWGGTPSVVGCVLWTLVQFNLFGMTAIRFLKYMKHTEDFLVKKSGASMTESLAIFSSVAPFCSVGVLFYEMVAVGFFIVKLIQDSRMIRATAIAMEVAQIEGNKNAMYNMSQTPNSTKSRDPMRDDGQTDPSSSDDSSGGGSIHSRGGSAGSRRLKQPRRNRKTKGKRRLKGKKVRSDPNLRNKKASPKA